MMNIAEIFDSLQENYPQDLVYKYEQLKEDIWLFMTDCDNDVWACFFHYKNGFIWRVEGTYEVISNIYKNRLKMKRVHIKDLRKKYG